MNFITIPQRLAPDSTEISAELYKLLIYEKGDKFITHRDTIRNEFHFGTLIIFLPSFYEGGDFVLRHSEEEESFNYSLSDPENQKDLLR